MVRNERLAQPQLYRPPALSATLLLLTVSLGLAVRFAPLGLPRGLSKYGGSLLWALAIYWLVSAVTPLRHPVRAVVVAGGLSTAVELLKPLHTPGLDAFRHTLAGVLLLGRHFSLQDVVAYWCAVMAGFLVDYTLQYR